MLTVGDRKSEAGIHTPTRDLSVISLLSHINHFSLAFFPASHQAHFLELVLKIDVGIVLLSIRVYLGDPKTSRVY